MELTFQNIIDLLSGAVFGGSSTLAGLALLLAGWAICAVICLNLKAPPTYSIVPLVPLSIFFTAYGILNETITVVIVVLVSVMIALGFKQAVD